MVEIHTGTARIALADHLLQELGRRLQEFGAPDAAERLQTVHAIRRDDKPVVREVIARWQRSGDPAADDAQFDALLARLGADVQRDLAHH